MKDEKPKYLVFRVYSDEERPGYYLRERVILKGWSTSKSVVKAFLSQRSKDKYKVKKVYDDEIAEYYSETDLDASIMIDFIPLKVAATGEEINFFTTKDEMQETEKKIQKYFRQLSSLVERDNGESNLLRLFVNLDDYYHDALVYIGFDPPELEDLFDDVNCMTGEDLLDLDIENGYMESYSDSNDYRSLPGLNKMTKISNKILYSVESFIKILREDM